MTFDELASPAYSKSRFELPRQSWREMLLGVFKEEVMRNNGLPYATNLVSVIGFAVLVEVENTISKQPASE